MAGLSDVFRQHADALEARAAAVAAARAAGRPPPPPPAGDGPLLDPTLARCAMMQLEVCLLSSAPGRAHAAHPGLRLRETFARLGAFAGSRAVAAGVAAYGAGGALALETEALLARQAADLARGLGAAGRQGRAMAGGGA